MISIGNRQPPRNSSMKKEVMATGGALFSLFIRVVKANAMARKARAPIVNAPQNKK